MDDTIKPDNLPKKPPRRGPKRKAAKNATRPAVNNPPDARLEEILTSSKSVAIIGVTPDQEAPSNRVARFLRRHGFRIYPVNPRYPSVLGELCQPFLRDVGAPVDVVCVFRRPEHLGGIIEDAAQIGARVIWLQQGIINEEFRQRAEAAGFDVVMDLCMKREYERLVLKRAGTPSDGN